MFRGLVKRFKFLGVVLSFFFIVPAVGWSREVITQPASMVRITKPDGAVSLVDKNESLPAIPSGSTIEILEGSAVISPEEGFIKVVVSGSVAFIKPNEKFTASLLANGDAKFSVQSGEVDIIAGNTTVKLRKGEEVQINFDKATGLVEVKSIRGDLETTTAGVKVLIKQDATAKLSADPKTRKAHIESSKGELEVISPQGESFNVAEGKSLEVDGAAEGEIQTFGAEETAGVLEEEPAEPQRPEGSPYAQ